MTTVTMKQLTHWLADPMCDCGSPLSRHGERYGCEECSDCWQFVSAEPEDVRDDDGMEDSA